jgi:Icc-related predicted phosphoesterase
MRLVIVTDIHQDPSGLAGIGPDLAEADLVLLAGDLTHFGRRPEMRTVVEAVRRYNRSLLAVPGNCDDADAGRYLADEGIGLDGRHVVRDGIAFLGLGGSLPCPGRTPTERSEEELSAALEAARAGIAEGVPLVLLSHQPPRGTRVDRIRSGAHVGSEAVRAFLLRHRPRLCATGHIHEASGVDALEETRIMNPGPLREGRYGAARIGKDGTVEALAVRGGR